MKIRENVKISELTTMKIGGIARYVIEIEKPLDIEKAYEFCKKKHLKHYFLGSGANTFGTDEGFDGAIIINRRTEMEPVGSSGERYVVAGGVDWNDFVDETVKHGLTGIECLAGIPGTVGAAPVQNIGAYGQEVAEVICDMFVFDWKKGATIPLFNGDCKFGYRKSIFNGEERGRYFIEMITFDLRKGEIEGELYGSLQKYLDENNITSREPKVIAEAVRNIRNSKLPKVGEEASSGSFFKNVYVSEDKIDELDEKGIPHHGTKLNTAWLLEKSGVKGKTFYGFRVSEKAPLVLINDSAKSYSDLEKAVKEISEIVEKETGFKIEQEPNVIGK